MHLCLRSLIVIAAAFVFDACGSDAARQPAATPASGLPAATGTPPAGTSPGTGVEFGAAECDDYMKAYLACIDRMPAAAQSQARQALEQTRISWKQAVSTEQGRAALAMTCKAASDAAAPAMRAYGCSW